MKIEQLKELNEKFKQLEELQNLYVRFEKRGMPLSLSAVYNSIIDPILNNILQKYEKFAIEDLKEEIKKREAELENISILQLNKLV